MEIFVPYLLLLIIVIPFSLSAFLKRRKGVKKLPPGSEGWPILGETLEFRRLGSQQLVANKMHKYSPEVFKTSLFGETMAVLCGAQGNKFVFTNENKLVRPWFPLSLRRAMFPGLDEAASLEPKAQFRSFHYDFLKPEALKELVPVIHVVARDHLAHTWVPNPTVQALTCTKKFTFELACKVFMDVVDPARLGRLLEPFTHLSNGLVSLPINLPGTDFNRALKGGKIVRHEVMRIVAERKEELTTTTRKERRDMLSKMLMATDEDGRFMSEAKVGNVMFGLLVAGQYEVSSAINIVIDYLARLPHIYDRVYREQMEIAKFKDPEESLTWDDVKMKYTWNVVRESLRLTPPALGSFRETTTEITFAGFTIPKGWKIMWTSHSTHWNPKYYPEPEKFDPSRFEGTGPAPYTFVAFGGGPRMCPGRGYARLVMLVFLHNLVTRFRIEKVIPDEKMFHRVLPTPTHGLPLRLRPHPISDNDLVAIIVILSIFCCKLCFTFWNGACIKQSLLTFLNE